MRRKSKDRPLASELRQRSAELGVDTMTGALLRDAADVIEAHERGAAQRALLEGLPLPPDVRAALAELAQLKAELSALRPLSEAGTQGDTLCPYCSADTGDGSVCARCSPGG